MNLSPIDAAIVIAYLLLVFGVGAYMERRAGKDVESYFLGGRTMPWWLLGMSGSSTFFDITGTMWMVSVFYVLGMRGLWEHWLWCFPFAGFVLAYKAKWCYRSGVLTGIEWLIFRFGDGAAGRAARLITVAIALLHTTLMLGYAGTGVGKFLSEFLPWDSQVTVPLLFAFTGLYVILGGFFSVVFSDFFQTILLSVAAIYIAVIAFLKIDPQAFQATVGADWYSLAPVWKFDPAPENYPDPFGLLLMMWVTKGVIGLLTLGNSVEFQRFRAARTEAEASKVGLAWGTVISVRWGLVMGFTAFGLSILAGEGGALDSESVLPMVINRVLPVGIKGIVIAGLLAAFMSTFDSSLNVAASFVVNDLVNPIWKRATQRQLIYVSYGATVLILVVGIAISYYTERIAAIWNFINFAVGSALLIPALLAPYWWRIGGWVYFGGAVCTLPITFCVWKWTDWRELQYFPILAGVNLVSSLAFAYLCPPAPMEALKNYYRKVRPFGLWGPVRRALAQEGEDPGRPARDRYDFPIALVGTLFFIFIYILAMDIVLHNWGRALWLALGSGILGVVLYFGWWRRLE